MWIHNQWQSISSRIFSCRRHISWLFDSGWTISEIWLPNKNQTKNKKRIDKMMKEEAEKEEDGKRWKKHLPLRNGLSVETSEDFWREARLRDKTE
jgi:hypothetical protein